MRTGNIPGAPHRGKSQFHFPDSRYKISRGSLGQKADLTFFRSSRAWNIPWRTEVVAIKLEEAKALYPEFSAKKSDSLGRMIMSEPFQHLLSPLQIGSKTLKNRIVFSAHGTMFADENHLPHEREIYYYGDRAKGGAGMIVIGGSHMHPTALHMPGIHNIADERAIPMYRRIAEAVHEHGAVILTQIEHIGRQATGTFTQQPVWAPSATPCVRMRETPKWSRRISRI